MTYIDRLAETVRLELPKDARPEEHAVELYRLYALLVLVRGHRTTLEDVHDAWSTWMSAYEPTHSSLRPFNELDPDVQEEDRPYLKAILALAQKNEPKKADVDRTLRGASG